MRAPAAAPSAASPQAPREGDVPRPSDGAHDGDGVGAAQRHRDERAGRQLADDVLQGRVV